MPVLNNELQFNLGNICMEKINCIIKKLCDVSGIVQNMDWTGLDSWTGQLDWTVGLDSWTGQLDWTIGLEFFSIKYMQFDVFEGNEMIIFKRLCFFL